MELTPRGSSAGECVRHMIDCAPGERVQAGTGELSNTPAVARQCELCPTGTFRTYSDASTRLECTAKTLCALSAYDRTPSSVKEDSDCTLCDLCSPGHFRKSYCFSHDLDDLAGPDAVGSSDDSCDSPNVELTPSDGCLRGGTLASLFTVPDPRFGCTKCTVCAQARTRYTSAVEVTVETEPSLAACTSVQDRTCGASYPGKPVANTSLHFT